jgi:hypothetical protein
MFQTKVADLNEINILYHLILLCVELNLRKCIFRYELRIPYLRVYKTHFFDRNLPSKIGVRLIHGM